MIFNQWQKPQEERKQEEGGGRASNPPRWERKKRKVGRGELPEREGIMDPPFL